VDIHLVTFRIYAPKASEEVAFAATRSMPHGDVRMV
jgi:hypothetical protein